MARQEDLEVQATPKIREALRKAAESVGRKDFARIAGVSPEKLESFVESEEFVPMTLVLLACKVNLSQGDTEPARTIITECMRGATIRVPKAPDTDVKRDVAPEPARPRRLSRERRMGPMMDQKSGRLLNFGFNVITFLVLGYVLGGYGLGPAFGYPSCDIQSPCLGSVVGLFIGAMASLAYTFYYFVRKM